MSSVAKWLTFMILVRDLSQDQNQMCLRLEPFRDIPRVGGSILKGAHSYIWQVIVVKWLAFTWGGGVSVGLLASPRVRDQTASFSPSQGRDSADHTG